MKVLGIIFAAILGLAAVVGLGIALDLGGLFYQKETAEFRGESEAERTIESGRSRIQHYNEFFNLCASIQAKEFQIDALKSTESMDEKRKEEAITAARIARQSLITEYNNKTARNYTAGRFKDVDLPYRISSKPYETEHTKCAE